MKPAVIFTRAEELADSQAQYDQCNKWCQANDYHVRLLVVNDIDLLFHQWQVGDTVVVLSLNLLGVNQKATNHIIEAAEENGVDVVEVA